MPSLELVATGSDRVGAADLWLVRAASLTDLASVVASQDWHEAVDGQGGFGLLLAWAGEAPDFSEVAALARDLIGHGMFYFGAWGRGSDRVEYAVDVTDVTLQIDESSGPDAPIVMTTSFGAQPLDDAVFELWEMAPRDEGKAPGPARVAVILGPDAGGALARTVRSRGGSAPSRPGRG